VATTSGSFFPVLLLGQVRFRMNRVRGKFAPPVACEQAVNLGMVNLPTQLFLQGLRPRRHDDHAGAGRLLNPGAEELRLLFQRQHLATPAAVRPFGWPVRVAGFRLNAADPRRTQADGGGSLFPGKTVNGGQYNGLGHAHFAKGLSLTEKFAGGFDDDRFKFRGP